MQGQHGHLTLFFLPEKISISETVPTVALLGVNFMAILDYFKKNLFSINFVIGPKSDYFLAL